MMTSIIRANLCVIDKAEVVQEYVFSVKKN